QTPNDAGGRVEHLDGLRHGAVGPRREAVVVRLPPGTGGDDRVQFGVVAAAPAGIAQHPPRLVDFLHRTLGRVALLGPGVDIAVGMQLASSLEVGPPYRLSSRESRDAEDLVVRPGHRLHGTRAAYGRRMSRQRSWWGWGWEDSALGPQQV